MTGPFKLLLNFLMQLFFSLSLLVLFLAAHQTFLFRLASVIVWVTPSITLAMIKWDMGIKN